MFSLCTLAKITFLQAADYVLFMKIPTSREIVFVNIVCIAIIALLYKLFSIPDTTDTATASGTSSYLTNTGMDSPVIINATARHTASV